LIGANWDEARLDDVNDAFSQLDDLRGDLPALEGAVIASAFTALGRQSQCQAIKD